MFVHGAYPLGPPASRRPTVAVTMLASTGAFAHDGMPARRRRSQGVRQRELTNVYLGMGWASCSTPPTV